ncbi:unnamed protein product [Mucor hiemalis]
MDRFLPKAKVAGKADKPTGLQGKIEKKQSSGFGGRGGARGGRSDFGDRGRRGGFGGRGGCNVFSNKRFRRMFNVAFMIAFCRQEVVN